MATELIESMGALKVADESDSEGESCDFAPMKFRIAGLTEFDAEVDPSMAIRDVKKLLKEQISVEPEHMRILYGGRLLKEAETLECYKADDTLPIQVMFTAGHTGLVGGTKPAPTNQKNPFSHPVRGLPGSKGLRISRISGRRGAMAIIRKYGILMKRQEFREKAEEIGFIKYR
mmetsp:Transcript_131430/g.294067  ORF Transcript_131430/g.294067 Transcript_131430/m.294067 type:complete len:174 (-) Transcript_131430:130-651(-)